MMILLNSSATKENFSLKRCLVYYLDRSGDSSAKEAAKEMIIFAGDSTNFAPKYVFFLC